MKTKFLAMMWNSFMPGISCPPRLTPAPVSVFSFALVLTSFTQVQPDRQFCLRLTHLTLHFLPAFR